jgi:hypothetical protein
MPSTTATSSTNHFSLLSDTELLKSLTNESQAHLYRIIARFVTNSLQNRKKFTESLAVT